jgi:hypothetical protein
VLAVGVVTARRCDYCASAMPNPLTTAAPVLAKRPPQACTSPSSRTHCAALHYRTTSIAPPEPRRLADCPKVDTCSQSSLTIITACVDHRSRDSKEQRVRCTHGRRKMPTGGVAHVPWLLAACMIHDSHKKSSDSILKPLSDPCNPNRLHG